jgi:hypothetical protein
MIQHEYKLLIVLSCIILHYGLSTSKSTHACSFWCDGSLHDPQFLLFVCSPFFVSICAISGGLPCTTPLSVCHRDSSVSSTATKIRCALVILVWNHRDPLVHSFHFVCNYGKPKASLIVPPHFCFHFQLVLKAVAVSLIRNMVMD